LREKYMAIPHEPDSVGVDTTAFDVGVKVDKPAPTATAIAKEDK